MRYLKVVWQHDLRDEPVTLVSELDDQNRELRKVEIFADGHYGFADIDENTSPTVLAESSLPPIEEIASDPQFKPEWISRSDFEKIWQAAHAVTTGTQR